MKKSIHENPSMKKSIHEKSIHENSIHEKSIHENSIHEKSIHGFIHGRYKKSPYLDCTPKVGRFKN
jgi:hypothetical protein